MVRITVSNNFKELQCEAGKNDGGALEAVTEAAADLKNEYLELTFVPDIKCTGREYVLFPACCYKGNQFTSLKRNYPPMFTEEEAGVEQETIITDVPRLEKDGSGSIQVTTGDVSVPCVGLYSAEERKQCLFIQFSRLTG